MNLGDYRKFVETGYVSDDNLLDIAEKIRTFSILSPKELAVLSYKTSEIERLFRKSMIQIGSQGNDEITDAVYERFIESGETAEDVLKDIASKIKNGTPLNSRENAVFFNRTNDIEGYLRS